MFNVGDKVVYGVNGVMTVEEIKHSPLKDDTRKYYYLKPVHKTDTIQKPQKASTAILGLF